ncbi:MAG: terminase family protein [Burkholderiales bacterium]|nr:terminase family protein [Burkholderiales bacterium]
MTEPQARFFQLDAKFPAFVGGFGAGKTETLTYSAVRDAFVGSDALIALYEPTYDLVKLILAPRIEERLNMLGIRYRYNKQDQYISTSSGGIGDFVMRTLDNPGRIIGYESYRAHIDELDTLKKDHAEEAWNKIIARNRQAPKKAAPRSNRVSVYTTPEGFGFVYSRWADSPKPGYEMVQAPTRSNPFLPEDYVETLRASYPANLIEAYLEGQFVNLALGNVYPSFDRRLNNSTVEIQPGEPLHVGVDFNVNNMAAIVHVLRDGNPIAVAEHVKLRDTPEMAELIRDEYREKGHDVTVYPDASGANRTTKGASVSDLSILRDVGGCIVRAPSKNPRVKDRINAMNAMICNAEGERRYRVNTAACPEYTKCLEQQPYDERGEPDKTTGHDHANDAAGYFIHYRWPVLKPAPARGHTVHHMTR